MRHLRARSLSLYLLSGASVLLVAQSTTTSALTGSVRDEEGRPLAGVMVRIASESLIGGERRTRTAENGSYRFPAVPPGRYQVLVEGAGLPPQKRLEVLELGRATTSNFLLKASAAPSAVVEVVAAAVNEEPASATTTRNFKAEDIENMPIARDISAIAALTPGVNLNVGSGTRTAASGFGGDRDNANAYLINGVNVGDPSSGQAWVQVNPDWFEEVQVGGIGASAEFGGFSGAYFNGLIKRGGNTFSGNVTAYYQKESWSARRSIVDPTSPTGYAQKTGDTASDLAVNAGGPILKDRLWYFVSLEHISLERTPVGAPVSEKRTTPRMMGNFTFQAIPSATLSLFLDYDVVRTDHRGASRIRMGEATTEQDSPSFTYGLEWLQTLSTSAVLTVRASGYAGRDDRKAYRGETYPFYVDAGVPTASPNPGYGPFAGMEELNNAYQVSEDRRSRLGLLATLDWFTTLGGASHAFKFGVDHDRSTDRERLRFPGNVSLNAFTNGGDVLTDFVQTDGGMDIDTRLTRTALFVQDTWTVNERLLLRPGLRWEQFKGGDQWRTNTLAPRLGFTLHLDAAKRLALKGHWGRYFNGLAASYYDRAIPGAYPLERTYWWGYEDLITDLRDPLKAAPLPTFTAPGTGDWRSGRTERSSINPDIQHPHMDEVQVSFEAKLGRDWSLGASWVQRDGKDLLVRYDRLPLLSSTTSVTNPLTGESWTFRRPGVNPDGSHDYYITNDPDAKRKYTAATLTADGRLGKAWDLGASITKARNKGNLAQSNAYNSRREWYALLVNAEGNLPGTNDTEAKLRVAYRSPWNLRVSANFTYLSGLSYTRYVQTSRLANRERFNIYIEPLGASSYDARRLLDIRVSQRFRLNRALNLDIYADIFNVLNDDAVISRGTRHGSSTYLAVLDMENPRTFRLGAKFTF